MSKNHCCEVADTSFVGPEIYERSQCLRFLIGVCVAQITAAAFAACVSQSVCLTKITDVVVARCCKAAVRQEWNEKQKL